jgi:cysteine desulfurase
MTIYLDHNAGSPVRPEVQAAIAALSAEGFGNPASVHRSGQAARRLLERARGQVAAAVGARPEQIVFTSGGTEANNLAIFGMLRASTRRRIVSSAIEHSSVLEPLARLEKEGVAVVLVRPGHDGHIDPAGICAALDTDTALLSLGLANTEVGTVQNLAGVARAAREAGVVFHLDAVQALGKMPLDVGALGCDLMSLSGHKLGAPGGIGAVYVRDSAMLEPQMLGGPQEHGLRGGSPNLLGAVGFGVAAELVRVRGAQEMEACGRMAAALASALHDAIPGLTDNHPGTNVLCNTLNFTFPGVRGETLLIALDLAGVEVSMGSACAAGAVEPSHVLLAMGRSRAQARSSLRLSLGYSTQPEEIERAAAIIPRVWRQVIEAEAAEVGAQP